jgi:hypothetical protein
VSDSPGESARVGKLSAAPDFGANTYAPHRKRQAKVEVLGKAVKIAALQTQVIPIYGTSPKAIDRRRNLR